MIVALLGAVMDRKSWRSYKKEQLLKHDRERIAAYIQQDFQTSFGAKPRFTLIDSKPDEKRLGTYGFISDAQHFIAGAVKKAPMRIEDYGFALEKIILIATTLRLGTCWLASFDKQGFAERIRLMNDEVLPAVTPIGYKSDQGLRDQLIRWTAGSDNRNMWSELFFDTYFNTPLEPENAGDYMTAFTMVQFAPSGSNAQSWRLILDEDTVHFYHDGKRNYNMIRQLDMGIAFSHFQTAMDTFRIKGEWSIKDPNRTSGKMSYVATWTRTESD